jgi:hypothetical protein
MMAARERLLAAIDGAPGAPVPCSFMIYRALRARCRDEFEYALKQEELGLDARVQVEDFPVRFAPEVKIREWTEDGKLHRAYDTPAGTLTAICHHTEDWPYGESIPVFDDWFSPRAVKYPVIGPENLPALRYLLAPPQEDDLAAFREQAAARKAFAAKRGFLFTGGWKSQRFLPSEDKLLIGDNGVTGTVIDMLMWLCGGTEPLLWAYDAPEFLTELIRMIEGWNRERLRLHLESGVELVMRRAWYEGTEFWSPKLYRQFVLPGLKQDVALAHEYGARFGYIITSGVMALADAILESGADVMVGVDPGEGKGTTLDEVAAAFGGKLALWGGVSGPLQVEEATVEEVRAAVQAAMDALAPTGRFILCPADNIRADTDQAWRNVGVFIGTWQSLRLPSADREGGSAQPSLTKEK